MVLALAEAFRDAGDDVIVVTEGGSYAWRRAGDMGLRREGLPTRGLASVAAARGRLARILGDLGPDVVHVHGSRAGFLMSLVPARARRSAVVYTVHGYHFVKRAPGLRRLFLAAERRASRAAAVTVFVSRHDRQMAARLRILPAGARAVVILNGIRPVERPSGVHADPKVLGFLGRMVPQKEPFLFVEVVRRLAADGYRGKMIGGGPLEPAIRRLVRNSGLEGSLRILGSLPHERAMGEMREVGVLVFPSRWEGLPLAPLEAMAMGIPVVAAGVAGIPEVIQSGVSGMLVPGADAESYAAALRRLAQDPDLRQQVVRRGLELVRTRFSHQRVASQHRAVYRSVLGLGQALGPRP